MDTGSNQPEAGYDPILAGATLDRDTLPQALSIRANTAPETVGSVRFELDGDTDYRSESVAPYALAGDTDGDNNAWDLAPGSHTVKASPDSDGNGGGSAGTSLTLNFTLVEEGGGTATPVPMNMVAAPACWSDSFAVNGACYCDSNLDHTGNGYLDVTVDTPAGPKTVREICERHATYPKPDGPRTYYNDVQCGNGPANAAPDEQVCPAIPNSPQCTESAYSGPTCNAAGPSWDVSMFQASPTEDGAVSGELRKWHKVTVSFLGPEASESGTSNPFLDYRLNVTFTHASTGKTYVVPGFFAADGDAANTSATSGEVWRVHFAPDETGVWTYTASFRTGADVAIATAANAGASGGHMDGATGTFTIQATNKTGRDLRGKGRLQYVGEHHLQFAETGKYFVKGGADAPENFLAYEDFDNTPDNGNRRKSWAPHAEDYQNDGPTWQSGKGTEIAGAINYLAAEGMNAFSFLTMNINGDDRNVFPYISLSERTRFDISKLDQWGMVFNHGTAKGMYLHFKMQETENDTLLDGGDLGVERKVYYRELVARFGHNLALNWNFSEEFNPGSEEARLADYSAYIRAIDPYDHHLVVHTYPGDHDEVYGAVVDDKYLTGVSIQTSWNNVFAATRKWREESAAAGTGQKWVVANDEQGGANYGVPPDAGCSGAPSQADIRRETLWGNLMAGGAGVEYYFGYSCSCTDLTCQDYRSRDTMWDYTRHALTFFDSYLPFWEMANDNVLTAANDDWVLAKPGEVYAIYLPGGGTTALSVPAGMYDVRWYDPRNGGALQMGSVSTISGAGAKSVGDQPDNASSDWVVLVTKQEITPTETPTPVGTDSPSPTPTPEGTVSPDPTPTPVGTGFPNPTATLRMKLFLPALDD